MPQIYNFFAKDGIFKRNHYFCKHYCQDCFVPRSDEKRLKIQYLEISKYNNYANHKKLH